LIEESKKYKSIALTPEMTALDVMTIFRSDNTISDAGAWTIFEIIDDLDLGKIIIYNNIYSWLNT